MTNMYGKYTPPTGTGGSYLKLKDGESAKIRIFSDEPLVRNDNFQGKPITRYTWVIYNLTENKAQLMDQSVLVYKSIENMALSEWGDPTTYDLQVKRVGEGTATRYYFTPLPHSQPLTADQEIECKTIDLKSKYPNGILLSEAYEGKEVPPASNNSGDSGDPGPSWEPSDDELNAVGF